jgi:nucleoside-diphosphate-sugar epimerase
MAAAAAGQPVTVVRPGLLYGPGRRPPLARQSFAVGPYRFILGSNQYLLPLVHVDNVADAIALALTTPAARGRAYTLVDPQVPLLGYVAMYRGAAAAQWRPIFVSTGMVLPLAKAATALLKLARRRSPVTPHQIRRATDSARYDCSRAERELGWKSRVSLADGLRQSLGGSSAPPSSSPLVSKPVSE